LHLLETKNPCTNQSGRGFLVKKTVLIELLEFTLALRAIHNSNVFFVHHQLGRQIEPMFMLVFFTAQTVGTFELQFHGISSFPDYLRAGGSHLPTFYPQNR
jgi:hypothetical protein